MDNISVNDELVKTLIEERNKLYPNGCPIPSRGCGKTYLYLSHFLRYYAYNLVCKIYKDMSVKMTLEEAYKNIDNFVIRLMSDL